MGFESLYVHGTLNSYMCRQKERYEKLYFMFCIYYDLMFVYNHHFCLCSGFCFLPRCMHKLFCIHSMIFYVPELVGGKRAFKNQYRLGTWDIHHLLSVRTDTATSLSDMLLFSSPLSKAPKWFLCRYFWCVLTMQKWV